MSSGEHVDRDSLCAYVEKALSIDATRWVEHHLEGCAECRAKLESERSFLGALDALHRVEPPPDFAAGVMARVAQYPAFQPVTEVPWRRLALWAGSLAALLLVVMGIGTWLLMSSPEGAEVSGYAAVGIPKLIELFKEAWSSGAGLAGRGDSVLGVIETVAAGVLDYVRRSGLAFQLAILLVTVALNYLFTRMVLNYQRRH